MWVLSLPEGRPQTRGQTTNLRALDHKLEGCHTSWIFYYYYYFVFVFEKCPGRLRRPQAEGNRDLVSARPKAACLFKTVSKDLGRVGEVGRSVLEPMIPGPDRVC